MIAIDKRERLPVFVITGFLGSGKTTLINRLLKNHAMQDSAIIVNEFGDIGIDHLIVSEGSEEIVLLESGCLCCMATKGLKATLEDLHFRRTRGELPPFRRIIVETSGLADPAPLASILMADYFLGRNFVLAGVLGTVDALLGLDALARCPEAARQAAFADRLVVTKTDMADRAHVAALTRALCALNPLATVIESTQGAADPVWFAGLGDGLRPPARSPAGPDAVSLASQLQHQHDHQRFRSDVFWLEGPSTWPRYSAWVEALRRLHGPDLLRIKGLIEIGEAGGPYVVQAVQHVVSPPERLESWPSEDRRPRIVAITHGIPKDVLAETFCCLSADQAPKGAVRSVR